MEAVAEGGVCIEVANELVESPDQLKLQPTFPSLHVLRSNFFLFPDCFSEFCSASSGRDEALEHFTPTCKYHYRVWECFSPGPATGLSLGGFGSAGAGAWSAPAWFLLVPWGSPGTAGNKDCLALAACSAVVIQLLML